MIIGRQGVWGWQNLLSTGAALVVIDLEITTRFLAIEEVLEADRLIPLLLTFDMRRI